MPPPLVHKKKTFYFHKIHWFSWLLFHAFIYKRIFSYSGSCVHIYCVYEKLLIPLYIHSFSFTHSQRTHFSSSLSCVLAAALRSFSSIIFFSYHHHNNSMLIFSEKFFLLSFLSLLTIFFCHSCKTTNTYPYCWLSSD